MYLFDTHTHFDLPIYDHNRDWYNQTAYESGVRQLVLIGYVARYFERMRTVCQYANAYYRIGHHLACGLHPLYVNEHSQTDLWLLDDYLKNHRHIAIAEIGLDTYLPALRQPAVYQKQIEFFVAQIHLSRHYDLPIMLHIRKAHADVLKLLKDNKYNADYQGGIAHSFSGGENEAIAFAKLGFKIGITGQITNPNAKKLHKAIKAVYHKFGLSAFVIETDCPDMTPLPAQSVNEQRTLNEPKYLRCVIDELSRLFDVDSYDLAQQLWQNTNDALKTNFCYPD